MHPPTLRFPHPLVLLVICVAAAAVLTWVLPAGEFERREDPATGRMAVVPGTYHAVDAAPVGPWEATVAIQKGIVAAASVVAVIFLVGGAFSVVEETGALARAVAAMVGALRGRGILVIPASALFFAAGGATFGMGEEIVAFIPMLLLLVQRLGYDPLTAVAMSYGAAAIGVAFSPLNPFAVGVAQQVAGLPLLSGAGFRMAAFLPAWLLWVGWTMRHAHRSRVAPDVDVEASAGAAPVASGAPAATHAGSGARTGVVIALVVAAFVLLVVGVMRLGWGIDEISALFFAMGVLAGLAGGLGVRGTAEAFVRGFASMAFAGLIVGFARAILVVLEEGRIIDTIVNGLAGPLGDLPTGAAALAMLGVQSLLHFPVPSTSGQAMITLPILAPLADVIGMTRQTAVLAYQFGAGIMENVTPTNGALMAMLALCRVPYDRWIRFCWPAILMLLALAAAALLVAVAIRLP